MNRPGNFRDSMGGNTCMGTSGGLSWCENDHSGMSISTGSHRIHKAYGVVTALVAVDGTNVAQGMSERKTIFEDGKIRPRKCQVR